MAGFEEVRAASLNPAGAAATALSVPSDICREIFLRLPAKSLIRFRAVCKAWRSVLDDPCFVKAHTNNQLSSNSTILIRNSTGPPLHALYSFDLDALNFTDGLQTIAATPLDFTRSGLSRLPALPVAACNGLMLVTNKIWEIWNPLTDERLELPLRDFNPNVTAIGLGYDYASDDYKAVAIDCHGGGHGGDRKYVYRTHVYSLKSGSWREIMNCPCDDWRGLDGPGVFLSGALNWISWGKKEIIALDLGTENYRQMRMPPFEDWEDVIGESHLDALAGCLVLSDYGKNDYEFKHFDVWVMKDYGVEDSWIKLFSIEEHSIYNLGCGLRPVAYMKNKMQVFLQDRWGFYLFDVESNSVKMVSIHGLTGILYAQMIPASIFRLHDNCGVRGNFTTQRSTRIRKRESKMKISDTELTFCVSDASSWYNYHSHDSCFSLDSNCYYSSSEDED